MTAPLVVDATGRSAVVARQMGATRIAQDHLVCFYCSLQQLEDAPWPVLIESTPDGWWYSSGQPNGRAMLAFFTLPGKPISDGKWLKQLAKAPHTWQRLEASNALSSFLQPQTGHPRLWATAANSYRLKPAAGPGWLTVGDATMGFDPLSSLGIFKALESATKMAETLTQETTSALRPEEIELQADALFSSYLTRQRAYYALEKRWSNHLFWNHVC